MNHQDPNPVGTLVIAGPGTGKTTSIVEEIVKLVKAGSSGDEIACTTFTRKAAEMMRGRINKISSENMDLRPELRRIRVGTVHSISRERLGEEDSEDDIVSNEVMRMIIYRSFKRLGTFNNETYLVDHAVPKIENALRYVKSYGILPQDINEDRAIEKLRELSPGNGDDRSEEIARLLHDFIAVFRGYEDFKKERSGLNDYNDLLIRAAGRQGKRYRHLFVDEFQDLSRLQVQIIEQLGESIYCVGDRKQSIFGFQGGSLHSFRSYIDNSSFEKRMLSEHHRSTREILDYSSQYLLSRSTFSDLREEIEALHCERGHGEKVNLVVSKDQASAASGMVKRIMADHPSWNICVIARSNALVSKVSRHLAEAGIDHFRSVRTDPESTASSEIIAFLKGLAFPESHYLEGSLVTPFSGLDLREAGKMIRSMKEGSFSPEMMPDSLFKELLFQKNGINVLRDALDKIVIPISVSLGETYLSCARRFRKLTDSFISDLESLDPEEYFTFLKLSTEDPEEEPADKEVSVMTAHKAKGLEFDCVIYVPSSPPSKSRIDMIASAVVSSTTGIDVEKDLEEEGIRVDYVAFTRSKNRLIIVCRDDRMKDKFILDGIEVLEDEYLAETGNGKESSAPLQEAYAMFCNGRVAESQEILKGNNKRWIRKAISDYFTSLSRISFSLLKSLDSPVDFLKSIILRIDTGSDAARLGTEFHQTVSKFPDGHPKKKVSGDLSKLLSNYNTILDSIQDMGFMRLPASTEVLLEIPMEDLFSGIESRKQITFAGYMDALFRTPDGGKNLIIDYKTGRKKDGINDHFEQLSLYALAYSKLNGYDPSRILVGVAFVNLYESSVSTTSSPYADLKVKEWNNPSLRKTGERIRFLLNCIEDPDIFISRVLEDADPSSSLDRRILSDIASGP